MFKNVSYKKLTWIKNASQDCGALHESIKTKKDDEICVYIESQKNGRMWTSCSPSHLLTMLTKDINMYEVITKGLKHKCHFDIDCDLKNCKDGLTSLETYKKIILSYIPDAILAISGSETEEKHSYHIVITNYTINDEKQRDNFQHFVTGLHEENNGFDCKIYTNNRYMKIINQSKRYDPRIQEIIENDDPKNHLITCFIEPNTKSVSDIEMTIII